jgi:hypothetical protein
MQQKFKNIFYRIAIMLSILVWSNIANAQETDSVRIAINNILSPLNKSLIPTPWFVSPRTTLQIIKSSSYFLCDTS